MPAIAPADAALRRSSIGSSRMPVAYQLRARSASYPTSPASGSDAADRSRSPGPQPNRPRSSDGR